MLPEFGPLADWAFWVGLAAKGARFTSTGRIDVDYAYAGHVNPAAEPWRTQIHEWSRTVQEASWYATLDQVKDAITSYPGPSPTPPRTTDCNCAWTPREAIDALWTVVRHR